MRKLTWVAALAAGLFAVTAGRADDKPASPGGGDKAKAAFEACAKACADCAKECESCGKHCTELAIQGQKEHAKTAALCCDCAAICIAAMKTSATKGPMAGLICEACAKACDACGAACDKHAGHDEHMARCAKACKDCAKACRDMVGVANWPHGAH
jgi:hypothetical protein